MEKVWCATVDRIDNGSIFCEECRKYVEDYSVELVNEMKEVGELQISYIEKIPSCKECGKPIYIHEIELENTKAFKNAVLEAKKSVNPEGSILNIIDEILMKYSIGKKPLSLILGWGESTINRYYKDDSAISPVYAEVLKTILEDPKVFKEYLEKNKELITDVAYRKSSKALNKYFNINQNKVLSKIDSVSLYLLLKVQDITPLALQKLLYYSQSFNKVFNGEFLFEDNCEAWVHGPVYKETYEQFKPYKYNVIDINSTENMEGYIDISIAEKEVLDSVIANFGCYSGKILEKITHLEKPWIVTRGDLPESENSDRIIDKNLITDYFEAVKEKYRLLNPNDIKDYSEDMFNKIH